SVMPIRNIEQKIERVGGLFGKRNREDIGCPFPKHSCGERGWAHADAVCSHTKAGTHLVPPLQDRKRTRLNSSHVAISYAVFCLKSCRPPIPTLFPYTTLFRSGVMPIRNIEQKIERVGGLFGKRNREDIGCPFPKYSCGERGWAHADAVCSHTKAGTHLLPPLQRDALVYDGQGSVRYGERDSQHVVFNGRQNIAVLAVGKAGAKQQQQHWQ